MSRRTFCKIAPISSLSRNLLLFLTSFTLSLSPCAEVPEQNVILVVSTFPRKANTDFYDALVRKVREKEALGSFEPCFLQTMADEEIAGNALSQIGVERLYASICLDARSVKMLAHKTHCPSIIIVRWKEMLGESARSERSFTQKIVEGVPEDQSSCNVRHSTSDIRDASGATPESVDGARTIVLETGPPAECLVETLGALEPYPREIGIVYTLDSAGDRRFLNHLRELFRGTFGSQSSLIECGVSAAACRNANAIENALERTFMGLDKGRILVVLPGQNTLKFSFVFRNYTNENGLGLVSLGEFPSTGSMFHIAYAPEELAEHCLYRILHLGAKGSREKRVERRLEPRVMADSEVLDSVGYSVKGLSSALPWEPGS